MKRKTQTGKITGEEITNNRSAKSAGGLLAEISTGNGASPASMEARTSGGSTGDLDANRCPHMTTINTPPRSRHQPTQPTKEEPMTRTIEFFGGPMNGQIRTIPNDMEVFTCYTMPSSPPPTGDAEISITPTAHIYRLDERHVSGQDSMAYHGTVDKEKPPMLRYLQQAINIDGATALAEIIEHAITSMADVFESQGDLRGSVRFNIQVRPFSARPSVIVDGFAHTFAHQENWHEQ